MSTTPSVTCLKVDHNKDPYKRPSSGKRFCLILVSENKDIIKNKQREEINEE